MKDTWTVTAVKPKYQTYVVVIGESARRDASVPLAVTGTIPRLPAALTV